jgi:alkylation response protein AidB-like acyl-CoA dehydrogenase
MVDHATVSYCAVQLGVSESSLERTAAYTRERVQFGRPIGSFQAVHQRVADAYSQLEAMRLTFMQAAWRLSQGMEATRAIGAAKFWAAEGGQFIAFASQHLHGGIGIDVDYPLHRYFLWSMQNEHSLGSASAQLATLGREIADRKSP